MKLKIEKNIPIPPKARAPKTEREQLAAMKIGDSVRVPKKDYPRLYQCGRKLKIGLTSRWNGTHVRIWRVK